MDAEVKLCDCLCLGWVQWLAGRRLRRRGRPWRLATASALALPVHGGAGCGCGRPGRVLRCVSGCLAGSAPAPKVWQGSAACRGRRCVCCGAMLGRCCRRSDGCRPSGGKSHPRLSSSCLLKGGAGGSNSLAREATGMAVASEALPLPSEAPGWRLCCAELARHRSGRPMVVLRLALARHWAHRLKGQCLAVQCWG